MAQIKIMSWNIENINESKIAKDPKLLEQMARIIHRYEADIVLIMESEPGEGEGFQNEAVGPLLEMLDALDGLNDPMQGDEEPTLWHMINTDATFRAVDLPKAFQTSALVSDRKIKSWNVEIPDDDDNFLVQKNPLGAYSQEKLDEIIDRIRRENNMPDWEPTDILKSQYPDRAEKPTGEIYEDAVKVLYDCTAVNIGTPKKPVLEFTFTLKQTASLDQETQENLDFYVDEVSEILREMGIIKVDNETYTVLARGRVATFTTELSNEKSYVRVSSFKGASRCDTSLYLEFTPKLVYLDIRGKPLGMHEPSSAHNGRCPMLLEALIKNNDDFTSLPLLLYHLPFLKNKQPLIKRAFADLNKLQVVNNQTAPPPTTVSYIELATKPNALLFGDFNIRQQNKQSTSLKFMEAFKSAGGWTRGIDPTTPDGLTSLTTLAEYHKNPTRFQESTHFRVNAYDNVFYKFSCGVQHRESSVINVIRDFYLGMLHNLKRQLSDQSFTPPFFFQRPPYDLEINSVALHDAIDNNENYLDLKFGLWSLSPQALLGEAFKYYRGLSDHLPIIATFDVPQ